jgi:hypothetical protein
MLCGLISAGNKSNIVISSCWGAKTAQYSSHVRKNFLSTIIKKPLEIWLAIKLTSELDMWLPFAGLLRLRRKPIR